MRVILFVRIGGAAIGEGTKTCRVQPDRFVVIGNGAVKIALGKIGGAARIECTRIVWFQLDGLAVIQDGMIVILLRSICDAGL